MRFILLGLVMLSLLMSCNSKKDSGAKENTTPEIAENSNSSKLNKPRIISDKAFIKAVSDFRNKRISGDSIRRILRDSISSSFLEKWIKENENDTVGSIQSILGYLYANGKGCNQDYKRSFILYQQGANKGIPFAMNGLAVLLENGKGTEKDLFKAFEWYTKAAEQGDARAQCFLGLCYYNGLGTEKDLFKAFEWCTKSAEQGDAMAQCFLGLCYYYGVGTEKDLFKAFEWYTKAAEQGDALAQFKIAGCYYNGWGTEKDLVKAFEWYTKAAEQGNGDAQYYLAWLFIKGEGVEKNYTKALEWSSKSAKQGQRVSKKLVADICLNKLVTAENIDRGLKTLRELAQDSCCSDSQYKLGLMYEMGQHVAQDDSKAFELYRASAAQRYSPAEFRLGIFYYEGIAVQQNKRVGLLWIRNAASDGNQEAKDFLKNLKDHTVDKDYEMSLW